MLAPKEIRYLFELCLNAKPPLLAKNRDRKKKMCQKNAVIEQNYVTSTT